jgi:hypothetical protein
LSVVVANAAAAFTTSVNQLAKESTNLAAAGISPGAATAPSSTQILAFATKLHDMGIDQQQLGYNELLTAMATNDQYGDAIRAALLEGRAVARSSSSGIPNTTKIDPMAVLKRLQG